MEQETKRICLVCSEPITGDYIVLPVGGGQQGGCYHTGDKQQCGPGSINWLKKFGLGKFGKVLYKRKGGTAMNEPCPEFGKGFSKGAKECRACMVVDSTYSGKCKEETEMSQNETTGAEIQKPPKKVKSPKKVGEPSTKSLVYVDWKAGVTTDKILSKYQGKVKDITIKSWISCWGKGKYLPKGEVA